MLIAQVGKLGVDDKIVLKSKLNLFWCSCCFYFFAQPNIKCSYARHARNEANRKETEAGEGAWETRHSTMVPPAVAAQWFIVQ